MLNPNLPVDALAKQYASRARVLVPQLLLPRAADDLYDILARRTVWSLVHNEADGRVSVLSGAELAAMTQEEKTRRLKDVLDRSRDGFSFLYRANLMADRYLNGIEPEHPLHRVVEFINGPEFLDLVRRVTGISTIARADAQATLYGPGDFLTAHDDRIPAVKRRVAYVMGMSRGWKADWGGLLQFYDASGAVEQVFVPRFNSLMLFTVQQMHSVTAVAACAPMARYSITGWFIDP